MKVKFERVYIASFSNIRESLLHKFELFFKVVILFINSMID